jgi:hypothetical protein
MAPNANMPENDSPLGDLILKMSAKIAECVLKMNTIKNGKTHSRNPSHLESIYTFENRMININDEILLLAAYDRAGMASRLTDLTGEGIMDMDTALYKVKRLNNKLDGFISDVNGFQSRANAQAEMSLVELLGVKAEKVSFAEIHSRLSNGAYVRARYL